MKCPHCNKNVELGYEQTSPQMLLVHLKTIQKKYETDLEELRVTHPDDPTGYVHRKEKTAEKWKAWAEWVDEQIQKGSDNDV
jgi:hypothetical protein